MALLRKLVGCNTALQIFGGLLDYVFPRFLSATHPRWLIIRG
jgi:hypothetical protein